MLAEVQSGRVVVAIALFEPRRRRDAALARLVESLAERPLVVDNGNDVVGKRSDEHGRIQGKVRALAASRQVKAWPDFRRLGAHFGEVRVLHQELLCATRQLAQRRDEGAAVAREPARVQPRPEDVVDDDHLLSSRLVEGERVSQMVWRSVVVAIVCLLRLGLVASLGGGTSRGVVLRGLEKRAAMAFRGGSSMEDEAGEDEDFELDGDEVEEEDDDDEPDDGDEDPDDDEEDEEEDEETPKEILGIERGVLIRLGVMVGMTMVMNLLLPNPSVVAERQHNKAQAAADAPQGQGEEEEDEELEVFEEEDADSPEEEEASSTRPGVLG